MATKQSWETCKNRRYFDSIGCDGPILEILKKYGLHQVYACANEEIVKSGAYPLFGVVTKSCEEFIVDSARNVAMFHNFDDNRNRVNLIYARVASEKDLKKTLKRALAGCTHCKFYPE